MPIAESELWRTGMIRFTAFHSDKDLSAGDVYRTAFEGDAESLTSNSKGRISIAETDDGVVLRRVESAPGKIDVLRSAKITASTTANGEFPTLYLAKDGLSEINRVGTAICRRFGIFDRLAIGLVGVIPTADRSAAFDLLRVFLQIEYLRSERCADFHFRLNQPSKDSIAGSEISFNNLSTWTAINLNAPDAGQGKPRVLSHAVMVDLDVNTVADQRLASMAFASTPEAVLHLLVQNAERLLLNGTDKN
jgi:hypothetical protein